MSSTNSQCETFIPLHDAFVDGELDGSEKEQVASHVQTCEQCKAQMNEIEKLKVTLSSLPRRQMKRDLADSLDSVLGTVDQAAASQPAPAAAAASSSSSSSSNVIQMKGRRRWVVAAASAAAVVVVALAGSLVSKGGHQQIAGLDNSSQPIAQSDSASLTNTPSVAVKGPNSEGGSSTADIEDRHNLAATQKDAAAKNDRSIDSQPQVAQKLNGAQGLPSGLDKERTEPKTGGAHLTGESAQDENSRTAVVAHEEGSEAVRGRAASNELLALYEDDDDSSDIGVMTDEDGLYAIKL